MMLDHKGAQKYSVDGFPPVGGLLGIRDQKTINDATNPTLNKYKPLPPISNIPGLNPDSEFIVNAQQKTFRDFSVTQGDSEYIKLAKNGGRKNLLVYEEHQEPSTLTQNFNSVKGQKLRIFNPGLTWKRPDYFNYEEHRPTSKYITPIERVSPPFSCDQLSLWEREKADHQLNKSVLKSKKQEKSPVKERPDILPVDNKEKLKHLNAPRLRPTPRVKNRGRFLPRKMIQIGR